MASEWQTVSLAEVYDFSSGLSKPRSEFGSGYPFLSFKDVFYNSAVPKQLTELVQSTEQERARCSVMRGDVFLTRTSETMDELGMSSVALADIPDATFNGFTKRLRPKRDLIVPGFARYFFRSSEFRAAVNSMSTMSTRASLNNEMLERLTITFPEYPEQEAIAQVLGTLDDKIDLNRKMNETLEAMARALFKSWFVDFDPVRAKAEGRPTGLPAHIAALFPHTLVDSELGEIPKGWSVQSFGDISARISMGPFGSDIKTSNFISEGVPIIRGKNLVRGFVDEDFVYVSDEKADSLRNAVAKSGDIVITHRGTLGQVGIIPANSRFPRYVVSQSQMVLTPNRQKSTPHLLYYFLVSDVGRNQLLANTSQTGVPAIARPTQSVKSIRMPVCPNMEILEAFEAMAASWARRMNLNAVQYRVLSAVRDALLPKLISGELRLPKRAGPSQGKKEGGYEFATKS